MIDSEEGGTTVLVCNRTSCKRYYNWEYFRKTVGDGFVVQNQKLEIVTSNRTIVCENNMMKSKHLLLTEGFNSTPQLYASQTRTSFIHDL
jgi:hypothetical protein